MTLPLVTMCLIYLIAKGPARLGASLSMLFLVISSAEFYLLSILPEDLD